MNQKKRSQVTLIMAIAIAIVVVFSIFYFVARSSSKKKLEAGVEGVITKDVQPIKEFVSQCLSKTAKEGLLLIGRQGGVIFKSDDQNFNQGGLTVYDGSKIGKEYLVSDNEEIVWYGISATSDREPYPWGNFPVPGGFKLYGMYRHPPLDKSWIRTGGLGGDPIKEQLETFVQNRIEDCLKDISEFEKQGFSITRGEKKVDIIIGDGDVRFNLDMPLEIVDTAGKGKAEFHEFTDVENVRLGYVYKKIDLYIRNDFNDIMYEPPDLDPDEIGRLLSIQILRDKYQLDDIVRITDETSKINNKPFIFQYGRKNRRPALYHIPYNEKPSKSPSQTDKIDVLDNPNVNCPAQVNGKICCKPYDQYPEKNLIAVDPDCDKLIFKIVDRATGNELPQRLSPDDEVELQVWDGQESIKDSITGKSIALKDTHVIQLT